MRAAITGVQADSPAATSGLQAGDSIVSIDGRTYARPSVLEFSSADFTDPWRQSLLSHAGQTVHLVSCGRERQSTQRGGHPSMCRRARA